VDRVVHQVQQHVFLDPRFVAFAALLAWGGGFGFVVLFDLLDRGVRLQGFQVVVQAQSWRPWLVIQVRQVERQRRFGATGFERFRAGLGVARWHLEGRGLALILLGGTAEQAVRPVRLIGVLSVAAGTEAAFLVFALLAKGLGWLDLALFELGQFFVEVQVVQVHLGGRPLFLADGALRSGGRHRRRQIGFRRRRCRRHDSRWGNRRCYRLGGGFLRGRLLGGALITDCP